MPFDRPVFQDQSQFDGLAGRGNMDRQVDPEQSGPLDLETASGQLRYAVEFERQLRSARGR